MTLDPKALEAAYDAAWEIDPRTQARAILAAIQTYCAADLVPRSELDEREDQFDGLVHDRNEAHEDNVRWRADLTTCVTSLGETRAQVAALQKVLNRLINKVNELEWPADPLIECKHGIAPVQGWLNIHSLKGCIEQALVALTDTAEAAAQWVRLDDEHVVVPVELQAALQAQHDWHLDQTDEDQWGIIPAEAYAESGLCDRTVSALQKAKYTASPKAAEPVVKSLED